MSDKGKKTGRDAGRFLRAGLLLVPMVMLSGCGLGMEEKIAAIGKPPEFSALGEPALPAGHQRVVSLPMPAAASAERQPNSLWQEGRQTFFKDQRAGKVGDILTVLVEIDDEAEIDNESSRSRSGSESAGLPEFLGLPQRQLAKILPEEVNPANLVEAESDSTFTGTGTIEREEKVEVQLAAMVTDVLPNGNLLISGRQEVRVNFEVRELAVMGIIRPEDIDNTNTITYEKIAEARISYGGRGHITEAQQPRYGQQFFDIVFPW